MQDTTSDAIEYIPEAHTVQFAAPAAAPILVIEPAEQSEQYDFAVEL